MNKLTIFSGLIAPVVISSCLTLARVSFGSCDGAKCNCKWLVTDLPKPLNPHEGKKNIISKMVCSHKQPHNYDYPSVLFPPPLLSYLI